MGGTVSGGKRAAETNMKNDPDFYKRIGAIGGRRGTTGGFAYSKANGLNLHVEAGAIGGSVSRRGWKIVDQDDISIHYQNVKTGDIEEVLKNEPKGR